MFYLFIINKLIIVLINATYSKPHLLLLQTSIKIQHNISKYMVPSRIPKTQDNTKFRVSNRVIYVSILQHNNQESTNNLVQTEIRISKRIRQLYEVLYSKLIDIDSTLYNLVFWTPNIRSQPRLYL